MKPFLTVGTVDIYLSPVPTDSRSRSEREREAVASIVGHIFGPGTTVAHKDTGAPFIPGRPESISVSHSRRTAALAVDRAGGKVGIDIEEARRQLTKVGPRILSERETALYGPGADTLVAAWTLKEAAYKCAGIPGLDFRADIVLPDVPAVGKIVSAAGKSMAIIACGPVGDQWLSAVYLK